MFSLICVWINDWVNNREAGDLRRYRAHYDVIVMIRVLFIMLSIKAQLSQDAFWFVPDITFFAMWFIILLNILLHSFSINLLIDRGPLYLSMPSLGCLCAAIFILTFWRSFMRHMVMMTWSNGNIFRVTDPLWGEFTGEFPTQRPVTRSFDVFFDLRLDEQLSKQWRRRSFVTPSRSLWRHCNISLELSLF